MEKKQLALDMVGDVFGWKMAVVSQTSIYTWRSQGYPNFFGIKKPVCLMAQKTDGEVAAFAMDGRVISREAILTEYPELKSLLAKYGDFG